MYLFRVLDREAMNECKYFINRAREARHKKTLDHQKAKFERLYQKNKGDHSNQDDQYICHGSQNSNLSATEVTSTKQITTKQKHTGVRNISSTSSQRPKNSCWLKGPILLSPQSTQP